MRRDLLSRNIKSARASALATQEEIAHKAGLQTAVYSRIERAEVAPRLDTLVKISNALDVPIGDLVFGVDGRLT
ncbi:helix-turn-helix domain-containing protein [Conexibacter woesei]|uniref:helix-turn-helix domain-containing protein n=1 Tax=Conexibacter woesei TaxID=191495 RepID=UPI00041FEAC1|nr:helix-turn-helix transcriptional regulator [Conexibacter woesei]